MTDKESGPSDKRLGGVGKETATQRRISADIMELDEVEMLTVEHQRTLDDFLAKRFIDMTWWLLEDACALITADGAECTGMVPHLTQTIRRGDMPGDAFYRSQIPSYPENRLAAEAACASGQVQSKNFEGQTFVEPMSFLKSASHRVPLWYLAQQWPGRNGNFSAIEEDGMALSALFLARLIQLWPGIDKNLLAATVINTYADWLKLSDAAKMYGEKLEELELELSFGGAKKAIFKACERGDLKCVGVGRRRRIEPGSLSLFFENELKRRCDELDEKGL